MLPIVKDEFKEQIRVEANNTRGWPKNRKQLDWAKFHILEGMSPYRAAIEAGFAETTADRNSYKLKKKMAPFLVFLQEKKNIVVEKELEVTTDRVMGEMAAIGLSSWRNYVRPVKMKDGTTRLLGKPIDKLSELAVKAVQSFEIVVMQGTIGPVLDYRYKLHSKREALVDLGKHLGMFNERLLLEMRHRHDHKHKLDFSNVPSEKLVGLLEILNEIEGKEDALPGEFEEVDQTD